MSRMFPIVFAALSLFSTGMAHNWMEPALPPNAYEVQKSDGLPSLANCQLYVEEKVQSNWSAADTIRVTILIPSKEFYQSNRPDIRLFMSDIIMALVGSRSTLEKVMIEAAQDRTVTAKCPEAKLIEFYVVSGRTVLRRSWYDCNVRIGSFITELRTDCTFPNTAVPDDERIEVNGYELANIVEAIYYDRYDLLDESDPTIYDQRFAYVHNYFLDILGASHPEIIDDDPVTLEYTKKVVQGWSEFKTNLNIVVPKQLQENFEYFYERFDVDPNMRFKALGRRTPRGEMDDFVYKYSDNRKVLTRFLHNLYKFSEPVAIASGKNQKRNSVDTEGVADFFKVLQGIGEAIQEQNEGKISKKEQARLEAAEAKKAEERRDSVWWANYDETKWVKRNKKYDQRKSKAYKDAKNARKKAPRMWEVRGDTTLTASGLRHLVYRKGFGDTPQQGDHVSIFYTGWLEDGTKVGGTDRDYEHRFRVGEGKAIAGIEEAVQLMQEGGCSQFILPSNLTSGSRGKYGKVPAGASMILDVRLVDVRRGKPK
ncbi:MAG: FKBP-type peptidyl-prolyl cis-trans isomerase [Calditrichaeota bacterium]|nr:FKBP-type peptidyl-prolyl cis-trans isomerase [Calditrichota bacterium]